MLPSELTNTIEQFIVYVHRLKDISPTFMYMGNCQIKLHIGFSKSSKFKRVVLLVLMTFCVYVQ